jgi:hypothetical protein
MRTLAIALLYTVSGAIFGSVAICILSNIPDDDGPGHGFDPTGVYILVFGVPFGVLFGLILFAFVSLVKWVIREKRRS